MQDSLEDYVRISVNQKKVPEKISTAAYLNLQRKKECEAKAMKVVEFLIEGRLRSETLLSCLCHIDQTHYQDIVEERAITKLCGYCLCGNKIPDMPKKRYHISTKRNKVYDITDRKNFCSNKCYEASSHIKQQIDTSPLWSRKPDECPRFSLLFSPNGLPGEEVDQGLVKLEHDRQFTSVSTFTAVSLDEVIETEISKEPKTKKKVKFPTKCPTSMRTINELDEELNTKENEPTEESLKPDLIINATTNQPKIPKPKLDCIKEVLETNINVVTQTPQKRSTSKFANSRKKPIAKDAANPSSLIQLAPQSTDVFEYIKICLRDWLTLETLIFVHGEAKIKDFLTEKKLSEHFESLKIHSLQTSQQLKYMNICKKLQLRELADAQFDSAVTGKQLKPLPDFRVLKEESRGMDVKVKSFYGGDLYENEDANFPGNAEREQDRVLPLVSRNSQMALRRNVFLTAVDKAIRMMLDALELGEVDVMSDVQGLVKTFKLGAHNTVFKPMMWNVIAVVLLEISGSGTVIKCKLQDKRYYEYVTLLLKPFGEVQKFLSEIQNIVLNVDAFIEHYVTKVD